MGGLTGALSAGAFYGAGSFIQNIGLQAMIQHGSVSALMEASAIHFAVGAATGAMNAGITGGNVGLNAIESGVSAGVAYGAAGELGLEPGAETGWLHALQPEQKFIANLGFQTTVGALSGGVTANWEAAILSRACGRELGRRRMGLYSMGLRMVVFSSQSDSFSRKNSGRESATLPEMLQGFRSKPQSPAALPFN